MKNVFRVWVILLAWGLCAGAAEPASLTIPAEFLSTDSPRLKKVLALPITADFREASLREVVDSVAKQTQINLAAGASGQPASFTGRFERVPVRKVLYRLSREMHVVVEWGYLPEKPGVPSFISIRE